MLPADRVPTEHEEQRALVSLWRKCGLPRIFAIPNGEARGIAAARRLKAEGVSAGVPDMYCPQWRLWVEMKRADGGTLSYEQKDWKAYLEELGDTCFVCHGAASAVTMIRNAFRP